MELGPGTLAPGDGLLFPAPDARELSGVPRGERPERLIVLDGTWHQARQLFKALPELHALPAFKLSPSEPSRYRIRRPPGPRFVSTLEAVVQALEVLEPDTRDLGELLVAFDHMIDLHLGAAGRATRTPRRRHPKRRARRTGLPASLGGLVVVYAEAHRPVGASPPLGKQLLQVTGYRLRDGALFARLVKPKAPPGEGQLERMGIHLADLNAAPSLATVLAEFREFVGHDPELVTWNQHSARDVESLMGFTCNVLLKDVYFRQYQRVSGVPASLLSLCRQLGYQPEATAAPGRAGERLGSMVALTRGLWQSAQALANQAVAGDREAHPTS